MDAEYRQGALTYISGSLNYYVLPGKNPHFVLKLGVNSTGDVGEFEAPTSAYLVNGYSTNKDDFVSSFEGENSGFRLFAFEAGEATLDAAMESVARSGEVMIGYSLDGGSMSATFPVNLRAEYLNLDEPSRSVFDNDAPQRWLNCLQEATKAALERIQN